VLDAASYMVCSGEQRNDATEHFGALQLGCALHAC
jgi:hypothetical protein